MEIVFETYSGRKRVITKIEALIEGDVRIRGGAIIPLASISGIYVKERYVHFKDRRRDIYELLFLVIVILVIALLMIFHFAGSPEQR